LELTTVPGLPPIGTLTRNKKELYDKKGNVKHYHSPPTHSKRVLLLAASFTSGRMEHPLFSLQVGATHPAYGYGSSIASTPYFSNLVAVW